jgi:hypothetical protein
MRYTQDDQKIENVFHVQVDTPESPATRLQVANFFYDWWVGAMQTLVSTAVVLREVYVTDLGSATGGTTTLVPAEFTGGANVNEPLPNNVTLAIAARTTARGRSYRGRSFVVGLTRNVVEDSRYTNAAVVAVQNAYNALQGTYIEQGQLVVLSLRTAGFPRSSGAITPITGWVVVDNVVDSQRRRLPGRGQ